MALQYLQIPLGRMKNFIYILYDDVTLDAAVVDPAWDVGVIIDRLQEKSLRLQSILLTHGHFDHVNGLDALLEFSAVPVYLSNKEVSSLTPSVSGLIRVCEGDFIDIGNETVQVIHTPGHTPGGQCFYYEDTFLIAGDSLFVDGCGRCDLDNSNVHDMYASLQRLKQLPDQIVCLPGHDYGFASLDLLGNQKKTNQYLTAVSETEFIALRMG